MDTESIPIKKKRGRKPKEKPLVTDEPPIKRKRGRKRKCELDMFNKIKDSFNYENALERKSTISFSEPVPDSEHTIKQEVTFGNLPITIYSNPEETKIQQTLEDLRKVSYQIQKEGTHKPVTSTFNLKSMISQYEDTTIKPDCIDVYESEDNEEILSDLEWTTSNYSNLKYITSQEKKHSVVRKRIKPIMKKYGKMGQNGIILPNKTDEYCWWDMHPFNTPPLVLPYKYDELRDRFAYLGNFCSWSCMKAYNIFTKDSGVDRRNGLIKLLYSKLNPGVDLSRGIRCANPREKLKCFGGYQTIEEFRKDNMHSVLIKDYDRYQPIISAIEETIHEEVKINRSNNRLERTKALNNHENTLPQNFLRSDIESEMF